MGMGVVGDPIDGHHASRCWGEMLLSMPGQHGRVVGFKTVGGEHLLGGHGGTGVGVVGQLLGVVYAPQTRPGERRQALPHAGDILVVGAVEIVHGSQPPVIPHEGEAAADVARYPLVRMMMMVVVVMGEFVGHGGDRW